MKKPPLIILTVFFGFALALVILIAYNQVHSRDIALAAAQDQLHDAKFDSSRPKRPKVVQQQKFVAKTAGEEISTKPVVSVFPPELGDVKLGLELHAFKAKIPNASYLTDDFRTIAAVENFAPTIAKLSVYFDVTSAPKIYEMVVEYTGSDPRDAQASLLQSFPQCSGDWLVPVDSSHYVRAWKVFETALAYKSIGPEPEKEEGGDISWRQIVERRILDSTKNSGGSNR